jgi:uncharacterized protein (TIGR02301 family)
MVGASVLFFFGTSDIRSLMQPSPAALHNGRLAFARFLRVGITNNTDPNTHGPRTYTQNPYPQDIGPAFVTWSFDVTKFAKLQNSAERVIGSMPTESDFSVGGQAVAVKQGMCRGSRLSRRTRSAAPAAQTPEQPAPDDHDLQRLSEILGALHFLRGICNINEGQKWRNGAQALIDAEAPSGKRHDDMVASFNRGYSGFQQSYRTCTATADLVIRRYLEEGARIARDMSARYSNY